MKAVNLIPSDARRGGNAVVGRSQGAAYGVLGLIAGVAVLALVWGMAHHQVSKRRAEVASLTAQTARAQESATKLTSYTSFIALGEQRTQAVTTLVDSRFDWAHAFHELGRVLPHEASITSLEGTVGGAAATTASAAPAPAAPAPAATAASATSASAAAPAVSSATPPGSVPTFTLKGCATSQAVVAQTLQRLRLIDGVNAVSLQSSAKASSGGSQNASESPCGNGKPIFSMQITFDPLPSAPAAGTSGTKVTTPTGAGQ